MFFALFAAWHIFAAETLDMDMTPQEKKQTGVYKLDDKQKAALQQWIDAHYQKRSDGSSTSPITGSHPTLSENLLQSRFIRLSDDTLWNIRPEDVPIVQGWITPSEIIVSPSNNPFFPYQLTNKLTGSSVLARKVDKLPPTSETPATPSSKPKPSPSQKSTQPGSTGRS